MNLRVNLPEYLEHKLQKQATAAGVDVESFVLATIRDALTEGDLSSENTPLNAEQFHARLQNIVERHPSDLHFVDDSRESIYAGRGE